MASKLASGGSGASKTSAGSTIAEKATGTVSKPSSSSSTKASTPSKASSSSPVSKGSSGASKTSAKPASSLSSSGGSSGGSTRSSTVSSRDTNAITPSLSRSLTESSNRTAASSSAEAKAKTAGRNLRGDAQSRAAAADPAIIDKLLTYEALQSAMRAPREDDEELTLLEQLQTPYETRVERAGGAPFEGLVDLDGITAAIFGGQSAAERDAALAAQRRGPDPSRFTPLGDENLGLSYGMLNDMYRPEIDPESGFIRDPDTGTYYRPDLLPSNSSTRLAEGTAPSLMDAFKPLEGLFEGIQAEERRLSGELDPATVPMPRPRPAGAPMGIEAMSIPLPGQTEGGDVLDVTVPYEGESDEAKYARENPVTAPKKKTVLDSVVEGAGGLLEKTPLGGIAKSLFPDLWYGTGEAIKGIDDGVNYGSSGTRMVGTNFEDTANGGSLIEQQPTYGSNGLQGFIDLNGNGIDDRLEGGAVPPAYVQGPAPGNRVASFPTMPPYNPGRDNEWTYFSNNRLANGGIVHAYADGGPVSADSDPRMAVIAATEDVLEKIAAGSPPDEQDAAVLKEFVAKFGDGALRALNDNVKAGMKMNSGGGRMVSGPGGPKDDAIPAVIDGVAPAALSDGEYVLTAEAVRGAGNGDPERGAQALDELSQRLAAMNA
jgi:hypothetical protein